MTITLPNRTFAPVGIDASLWPDVATVPHSPVRAAVARRIFHGAVNRVPLRVVEPGGRTYGGGTAADPVFTLVRPDSFFARLGAGGTIGFGEAFMAGDWTADDLAGVVATFAGHMRELVPAAFHRLRHVVLRRQPETDDNTIDGARRNIHRHYDLSNDLFKTFLDESMSYSSAIFNGEPYGSDEDLAVAQRRKVDRLLDAAAVGPGSRVLEIGTGWGELAIQAAGRGATVTSLTISSEQADLARERIAAAGVTERAQVLLQDYRQASGDFDAVVSVEMIEAVGANHWDEYFAHHRPRARAGRAPGAASHPPGRRDGPRDPRHLHLDPQIHLPRRATGLGAGDRAGPVPRDLACASRTATRFGRHYAETLRRWRERFEASAADVAALGFDETFRRMWSLYLAYSEAGFRTGYLDVEQLTVTKPAR